MFCQKTSRGKKTLCGREKFRFVHPSPDAITHGREGGELCGMGHRMGVRWGEEKLDQTQILDLHYREAGGGEIIPAPLLQRKKVFSPTQYLSRHRMLRLTIPFGALSVSFFVSDGFLSRFYARKSLPRLPPRGTKVSSASLSSPDSKWIIVVGEWGS